MYKTILVPVSLDKAHDSSAALDVAKFLAGDGGQVTLLHVIERIPTYALGYMPEDFLPETRKAVEGSLNALAAKLPGATIAVVDGHSGDTIIDYANTHGTDCIVMASHHPVLSDIIWGSTAAQVVRHVDCSVHVVR